jgi:hypothetical protein
VNLDCGHICCHIRSNTYHVHTQEPGSCDRCRSHVLPRVTALTNEVVHAGPAAPEPMGVRRAAIVVGRHPGRGR